MKPKDLVTEKELALAQPKPEEIDFEKVREVIFEPNVGPQTDFLAATEQEVLYGGAAGGGKTFSLIVDPLRYCNNQNFNALILRRTNDELREIIHKSHELYPKAFPGVKWLEKKSQTPISDFDHCIDAIRYSLQYAEANSRKGIYVIR